MLVRQPLGGEVGERQLAGPDRLPLADLADDVGAGGLRVLVVAVDRLEAAAAVRVIELDLEPAADAPVDTRALRLRAALRRRAHSLPPFSPRSVIASASRCLSTTAPIASMAAC